MKQFYSDDFYKDESGTVYTGEYIDHNDYIKKCHALTKIESPYNELQGQTVRCNYSQIFYPDSSLILCNNIPEVDEYLLDNIENGSFWRYYDENGDYCYNLFIVTFDRFLSGFNEEEYGKIIQQAESIIDDFQDVSDKWTNGYNSFETYKEAMEYNNITYNSYSCHLLKEWAKSADVNKPAHIAEFLTITTGKKWAIESAGGYCQGDYVELVYCPEYYKDGVKHYGEIWLGAAKEFYTIDLDDNGKETDTCGGYIIADSQARSDEDYKRLVCEWAGIPENETQLELIGGCSTVTQYNYKAI